MECDESENLEKANVKMDDDKDFGGFLWLVVNPISIKTNVRTTDDFGLNIQIQIDLEKRIRIK